MDHEEYAYSIFDLKSINGITCHSTYAKEKLRQTLSILLNLHEEGQVSCENSAEV